MFFPEKSELSAEGSFSKPSTTVSAYLSLPTFEGSQSRTPLSPEKKKKMMMKKKSTF